MWDDSHYMSNMEASKDTFNVHSVVKGWRAMPSTSRPIGPCQKFHAPQQLVMWPFQGPAWTFCLIGPMLSYPILLCLITHDRLRNPLHLLDFDYFLRLDRKPIENEDQKFHTRRRLC